MDDAGTPALTDDPADSPALISSDAGLLPRGARAAAELDALGPWPAYLVAAGVVSLALFWLLWIPARPRQDLT